MTTTTVDVKTELISIDSITYIRPITLSISAKLMKPNAKMYAFFDEIDINRYFTQTGKSKGDQLVTDANGELTGIFEIPGMTFTTGNKKLVIRENMDGTLVLGSTFGSVTATFISTGVLQRYQTTETTTNTVTIENVVRVENPIVIRDLDPNEPVDPLAQSFFTFGMTDGCYITSVDLFFQTKDSVQPIWIELREMINGVPSNQFISPTATVVKNSVDVLISNNGTIATNFKFNKMVYLLPDKDYCFVIQSRSSQYNVWTSKLGENSIETGKIVFDQPYVGAMFKSSNNYSWEAENFEDIKFVLYKAEFDTNSIASLDFEMNTNEMVMYSSQFQTVLNTDRVYVTFLHKHALDINSSIAIACNTAGTYNGIPGTLLNNTFSIFHILDDYTVGFIVPTAVATSNGPILTGGLVTDIQVTNGGSSYNISSPPTITIGGPGSGASASFTIRDGKIFDTTVTAMGTGYVTVPTVTISGGLGTGATAIALIDSKFTVDINRIYHQLNPSITNSIPADTSIEATLSTTQAAFTGGTTVSYAVGKTYNIDINKLNIFNDNLLLASRFNESLNMANAASTKMNVVMKSNNKNVSPTIDLTSSRAVFSNYAVNNQRQQELLTSVYSSGQVIDIRVTGAGTDPGSGYTSVPTVEIYGTGTGATAHCTLSGGTTGYVNSITLDTQGYGYITAPNVIFVGGTPVTDAVAITTISNYNSELDPYNGSAQSRYITKKQQLATVSTGIRLTATAYSNAFSSFDIYIRTSLTSAGTDHDTLNWTLLSCDVDRNKSSVLGQYKDYDFYLDNIPEFDLFSFKIVLRSLTPWDPPIIDNYRSTILAA